MQDNWLHVSALLTNLWGHDWLFPAITVFTGYVVLGLTGFGSALVIVPVLAWQWPLPHVVALTLLLDLPACLLHGGLNLKQVKWDEVKHMWPAMIVGSGLGLWLMQNLAPRWPLLLLGLYVAAVGLRQIFSKSNTHKRVSSRYAVLAGGLAGAVEMMFGSAGPVMMTWLQWRLPDTMQLRATAPVLIVCSVCIVLLGMAFGGLLSDALLWQHWLGLIGVALVGIVCGDRLARSIRTAWLSRFVAMLLICSGLSLTRNFIASK
jgi:uncharacterized membrane protein YfcA